MRDDPCFSCPLPDCDTASHRCVVRRLAALYQAKTRRGEVHLVTEKERDAANLIFHIWKLERIAEASEGGRPYRRWKPKAGEQVPAS